MRILPCPGCGGGNVSCSAEMWQGAYVNYIQCFKCGASGPKVEHEIGGTLGAAEAWNRIIRSGVAAPTPRPANSLVVLGVAHEVLFRDGWRPYDALRGYGAGGVPRQGAFRVWQAALGEEQGWAWQKGVLRILTDGGWAAAGSKEHAGVTHWRPQARGPLKGRP